MQTELGPEPFRNGAAWLPVAEAAVRLGLSERGLRKRIAKGHVRARQTEAGWRVAVPEPRPGPVPEPGPERAGPGPDPPSALVDQLHSEIAHLREELAALHERLREAHLLLAQRPALPEGRGEDLASIDARSGEAETTGDQVGSRPWWARLAWWRR
jgi:type II secretory pathway component PulM